MPEMRSTDEDRELVREAEAVRQVRLRSLAALSPSERVERLGVLCQQVAAFDATLGERGPS